MEDSAPLELIPSEEIVVLKRTLSAALHLAYSGPGTDSENRQAGWDLLRHGRCQVEAWEGEPWGPLLLNVWDRTLNHYAGKMLL